MTISFARNTGTVDKRRAIRAPLGITASMRERGRTATDVRVATFSAFGCMVDGYVPLSEDGQAWLKLPGLESQMVTVVWVNGNRVGVEFDRPLHSSVAARYLPAVGSMAADYAARHPGANDTLQSRREQIMAGIVNSERSPLQRRKKPTGLGIFGKINRTTQRKADHRFETRFGENLEHGPREVEINGIVGAVRNVSPSGLRVLLPAALDREIGDDVAVVFDGFDPITGQLVWVNQAEIGIALPTHTIELFDSGAE